MSTPPDGKDVSSLFHEVVDLDPEHRERLYREREIPEALRNEVEALLGEEPLGAFQDGAVSSAGQRIADQVGGAGPTVHWETGTRVGDYEIVREIARGGMGVVFEARQVSLGRQVAIKVIRGVQIADSADHQRFRAEAEAIARLEHVGIVPVHEVAEHEGLQFYSMAYMGGGSLKDLPVPLDPREAAELTAKVCDAIHYAHTRNIVHRDLKPANVLLSDSLQPRVSDFGLAKDTSGDSDLTHTGAILGTPGFMAPEQASGDVHAVGHLADVYGLGAIFFHLLTGHPPIEGEHLVQLLHNVLHEDAPDPRRHVASVPIDLASVCRKALEKDPAQRYDSAAAMADDLRRYLRGDALVARPLGNREKFARWCSRHRALSASLAAAALAVVGGAATATWFALEANQKAGELARANATMQQQNQELAQANATMEAQNAELESANAKMEEQNAALVEARDEATQARGDAEAFSDFLIQDVVQTARPIGSREKALGTEVTMRDALKAAVSNIDERFVDRPVAAALARNELAISLRHTGEGALACDLLEESLETRRRLLGPNDPQTLDTMNSLGAALYAVGRNEESTAILEDLAGRTAEHEPELHPQVLENLASNYQRVGRFEEAAQLLHETLSLATEVPVRLKLLARLASISARAGQPDRAREFLARIDELKKTELGEITPLQVVAVEWDVIACLKTLGDDEALAERGVQVAMLTRGVFSPDYYIALGISDDASGALARLGRWREAAEEMERTIDSIGSRNHALDRMRLERCAGAHLRTGNPVRAVALASRCRERWQQTGTDVAEQLRVEALLGHALLMAGERQQAEALLKDAMARIEARPRSPDPNQRRILDDARAGFEALRQRLGG